MRTTEERDREAKVLAHLSLNGGEATYREMIGVLYGDITGEEAAAGTLQTMLSLVNRGDVLTAWGEGYRLDYDYEWYGADAASRFRITGVRRALAGVRCDAVHTVGYRCTRAPWHRGRHMHSGTTLVLAAWVPGGQYDQAARLTPEQIAEMDRDAADAF